MARSLRWPVFVYTHAHTGGTIRPVTWVRHGASRFLLCPVGCLRLDRPSFQWRLLSEKRHENKKKIQIKRRKIKEEISILFGHWRNQMVVLLLQKKIGNSFLIFSHLVEFVWAIHRIGWCDWVESQEFGATLNNSRGKENWWGSSVVRRPSCSSRSLASAMTRPALSVPVERLFSRALLRFFSFLYVSTLLLLLLLLGLFYFYFPSSLFFLGKYFPKTSPSLIWAKHHETVEKWRPSFPSTHARDSLSLSLSVSHLVTGLLAWHPVGANLPSHQMRSVLFPLFLVLLGPDEKNMTRMRRNSLLYSTLSLVIVVVFLQQQHTHIQKKRKSGRERERVPTFLRTTNKRWASSSVSVYVLPCV